MWPDRKGQDRMKFHLAETFTAALARLPGQESKATKATVVDLCRTARISVFF